mgnify:CR=1 FL=1
MDININGVTVSDILKHMDFVLVGIENYIIEHR